MIFRKSSDRRIDVSTLPIVYGLGTQHSGDEVHFGTPTINVIIIDWEVHFTTRGTVYCVASQQRPMKSIAGSLGKALFSGR